jgi:hypothetical protein
MQCRKLAWAVVPAEVMIEGMANASDPMFVERKWEWGLFPHWMQIIALSGNDSMLPILITPYIAMINRCWVAYSLFQLAPPGTSPGISGISHISGVVWFVNAETQRHIISRPHVDD